MSPVLRDQWKTMLPAMMRPRAIAPTNLVQASNPTTLLQHLSSRKSRRKRDSVNLDSGSAPGVLGSLSRSRTSEALECLKVGYAGKPFVNKTKLIRVGFSSETHRQSSEDFRRRFSRLFDEQLRVRPTEAFQLSPVPQIPDNDQKRRPRPQPL